MVRRPRAQRESTVKPTFLRQIDCESNRTRYSFDCMSDNNTITIILPATDETNSLRETLHRCQESLPGYSLQFLIVTAIRDSLLSPTGSVRIAKGGMCGSRFILADRASCHPHENNDEGGGSSDMSNVVELEEAMIDLPKRFAAGDQGRATGRPGKFEVPNWDQASQKKVRDALLVLGSTLPDFKGAFGTKDEVDPVRHLIGTAAAWGGNPDKDAIYLNVTPSKNDGTTIYKLDVKDVPVDAFGRSASTTPKATPEEPAQRVFAQQHHGEEKRGRLGRHPVRRLRRQDRQLSADHERLELRRFAGSIVRARKSCAGRGTSRKPSPCNEPIAITVGWDYGRSRGSDVQECHNSSSGDYFRHCRHRHLCRHGPGPKSKHARSERDPVAAAA